MVSVCVNGLMSSNPMIIRGNEMSILPWGRLVPHSIYCAAVGSAHTGQCTSVNTTADYEIDGFLLWSYEICVAVIVALVSIMC